MSSETGTKSKPKRERAAWHREYRARRKAQGQQSVQMFLYTDTWLAIQNRSQSSGLSNPDLIAQMLAAWDEKQANTTPTTVQS